MKNKKHINESQKDWGGYYSDNSMGTRYWLPSTPEDAMSVAKSNGENPSDVYRKILNAKEFHRGRELKDYGLPSDANLTNRRNLKRNNWINSEDDETPNSYSEKKGYAKYDEPEINQQAHSQRQQELDKTFNANDKKLRRMQKKAGVLNENTIKKIVAETLRRLIKEYEDDDLGDDYVDPDDWRSEEPSQDYVQSIFDTIQEQCNTYGAIFKNMGDNEFGVIIKDMGAANNLIDSLRSMEERGIIYNTGGDLSMGRVKYRIIKEINEETKRKKRILKEGLFDMFRRGQSTEEMEQQRLHNYYENNIISLLKKSAMSYEVHNSDSNYVKMLQIAKEAYSKGIIKEYEFSNWFEKYYDGPRTNLLNQNNWLLKRGEKYPQDYWPSLENIK